jgi:hypothetical protein
MISSAFYLVSRSVWFVHPISIFGAGIYVWICGRVPGREEDHVVAVAKRHELQTPKPDHRGQRERAFGASHPEKWREMTLARSFPYLARQLSASGPAGVLSQRVNQVLRVPNLDGDARRIHGDLSWFEQMKALRPAGGRVLYFFAPKCLRRGYKL